MLDDLSNVHKTTTPKMPVFLLYEQEPMVVERLVSDLARFKKVNSITFSFLMYQLYLLLVGISGFLCVDRSARRRARSCCTSTDSHGQCKLDKNSSKLYCFLVVLMVV